MILKCVDINVSSSVPARIVDKMVNVKSTTTLAWRVETKGVNRFGLYRFIRESLKVDIRQREIEIRNAVSCWFCFSNVRNRERPFVSLGLILEVH